MAVNGKSSNGGAEWLDSSTAVALQQGKGSSLAIENKIPGDTEDRATSTTKDTIKDPVKAEVALPEKQQHDVVDTWSDEECKRAQPKLEQNYLGSMSSSARFERAQEETATTGEAGTTRRTASGMFYDPAEARNSAQGSSGDVAQGYSGSGCQGEFSEVVSSERSECLLQRPQHHSVEWKYSRRLLQT